MPLYGQTLHPYSKLYLLVNTKNIILAVENTCEFTNQMMIPYLTYCTYDQMDILFF